ncbi:MAG TPA: DUF4397 domain-containing protein [Gemmatimonadales bacterium]|nr:DUF4397 domain-containing protein [Gemmatimonadales bacterium]
MPRIVPALALLGLVAACDPTGNTNFTSISATVRVANLVSDAPSITVSAGGANVASGVTFGTVSGGKLVRTEDQEFITARDNDNFVLGADSVVMTLGRHYTFYVLGTSGAHVARFALDDTTFGAAGSFKLRFVHGSQTNSVADLDLYVSAPADDISALSPVVPSLGYGAASPYIPTDTAFRRIRVTLNGQTTTLLDTTLSTAISDSTNVTLVVSDKQGGGTPMRLGVVVDKAP